MLQILFLFTNIFKVFMNILFLYSIYIESRHISPYGFVCQVNFSNEKLIRVENKELLQKIRENIYFRYS